MNLNERIKAKNSENNRVTISATISEKVNNSLEALLSESQHSTKELLIEIAVEDFLERFPAKYDSDVLYEELDAE